MCGWGILSGYVVFSIFSSLAIILPRFLYFNCGIGLYECECLFISFLFDLILYVP